MRPELHTFQNEIFWKFTPCVSSAIDYVCRMPVFKVSPRKLDSIRRSQSKSLETGFPYLFRLAIILGAILFNAGATPPTRAAKVVIIGDSLSAEYEAIPDFPGVANPTDYARVTVDGWEALSWVEVLARLRGGDFDFGRYRSDLLGWGDLRFSGYEFNFAIPGFEASQYEDIVNSSIFSNPQYLLFQSTLRGALRNGTERAVIWLGGNEFRANYGFIYDGGDPKPIIDGLVHDLGEIIDFVRRQSSTVQIVVASVPDLGATPSKQAAHPNPDNRLRVTEATRRANEAIAALTRSKGAALADVFVETERLTHGESIRFASEEILNGADPDNNPRYQFVRDGLHPNTGLQIEIARVFIDTFNQAFQAGIPQITDAEALRLLGLDPNQAYRDWAARFGLSDLDPSDDPDQDGLANLMEFAFGLNPSTPDPTPGEFRLEDGVLDWTLPLDSEKLGIVKVALQFSTDLRSWTDLKTDPTASPGDKTLLFRLPVGEPSGFLRVAVFPISPF